MTRRSTWFDALLACATVLLIVLVAGPVLTIALHIPINYNEGWNAGFDTRAVMPGSGPLYPGPDTLVFNNYPPLGFLLVGAAGRFVFGDMIVAGRVLALAGLLAAAAFIALALRGLGTSRRAAVAGALVMLLYAATFYGSYVAMADPQWLAHATMLGALALLLGRGIDALRAPAAPWGRIAAAAALMVAGGFIKHNLVALPLATTAWLLWLRPRAGLAWCAAAGATLAAGLAGMHLAYGPAAFADIFHHRRIMDPARILHGLHSAAPLLLPAAAGCAMLPRIRREAGVFAVAFLGLASVTGLLQRMGEGVYYNAHFETMIAAALIVGLGLDALRVRAATFMLVAILPIVAALPWHLPKAWHAVADRHARERAWQPVIAEIAAAHGEAGCLMLSVCYWAGKPFEVDMFNLTQSLRAGGPDAAIRARVRNRDFALFLDVPSSFLHDDATRRAGTDPVMELFHTSYAVVSNGPEGSVILAPRP